MATEVCFAPIASVTVDDDGVVAIELYWGDCFTHAYSTGADGQGYEDVDGRDGGEGERVCAVACEFLDQLLTAGRLPKGPLYLRDAPGPVAP